MKALLQTLQQKVTTWLQRPFIRIGVNVLGAMLLWGSWAAIVHHAHPLAIQLKAALTQAAISGSFTLVGAAFLEAVFARAAHRWRVPVAGLSTFSFIFASVLTIHHWAGTPSVLLTVAPTLTLSFFYCLGYAASLARLDTQNAVPN